MRKCEHVWREMPGYSVPHGFQCEECGWWVKEYSPVRDGGTVIYELEDRSPTNVQADRRGYERRAYRDRRGERS